MAIDLFRLIHGIDIQSDDLSSNAYVLQGAGAPGGFGVQDDAPIGSLFMRTDVNSTSGEQNLQIYYKWQDTNSVADWKVLTDKNYVDSVAQGLSWRKPVKAMDDTTTTTATMPSNPGGSVTIDGVTINNGDRVLFASLTDGGGPNVYVYNVTAGTWTEDTNNETDGDALLVQSGVVHADQQWVYDGAAWVMFNNASGLAELGYIRSFIGKNAAGAETPAYTNEFVVTTGNSLELGIDKLDTAMGDGNITNTGGNWALSSDMAFNGTNGAGGASSVTDAIDELNAAIGNRTYTNTITSSGESVATSVEALGLAINELQIQELELSGTNQTGTVTVDSIPLTDATEVKWMVQMRENVNTGKRRSAEVHAMTDGTTVDFTRYAELRTNNGVTGFAVNVVIVGANIELQVAAGVNYDFVVKRIAFSAF